MSQFQVAGTGAGTSSDFDFDTLIFNLPQTVKGTAYLSVTMSEDTGTAVDMNLTAQVKKLVGSVETTISSVITSIDWSSGATAEAKSKDFLLAIPLTQTHFRIGEQIRVTIKGVVVLFISNSGIL